MNTNEKENEKAHSKEETLLILSDTGGIIAAANPKLAFPLKKIGTITAVKRIVLMLKQAGVFPIVVLTGTKNDEVRYQLSMSGVVFLPVPDEKGELLETAKKGLEFLHDKCRRIVFTPVNAPFFTSRTLNELLKTNVPLAVPSYDKKGGHPILLDQSVVNQILDYPDGGGLNQAFKALGISRYWVDVDDPGILRDQVHEHATGIYHLVNHIALERERAFFSGRAKLLLYLIPYTHSVSRACDLMALSHGKGWAVLNELEAELGFQVVLRRHGGKNGGRTDLTAKGYLFLSQFQKMEEDIIAHSQVAFDQFTAALAKKLNE